MDLQFWKKGRRASVSDLRITPGHIIMVDDALWPARAVRAAVGYRNGYLLLVPVSAKGRLVGDTTGAAPIALEHCYVVRSVSRRRLIYASAFVQANQLPSGDWTHVTVSDGESIPQTALAFLPHTAISQEAMSHVGIG